MEETQSVQTVSKVGILLKENLKKIIIGKDNEIDLVISALLSNGHILLEDVPGVGKTVLSKACAKSLGCSFSRVQCTPDLLPGDLLGVNIFNQKTGDFEFRPGPIFCQVLLADEINRATPKTQSALLECMDERHATISGVSHPLPKPFCVLATQNPIEYEGTFILPEAQLDRFAVCINLGYPTFSEESHMLDSQKLVHPLENLEQVVSQEELLQAQALVKTVSVEESLREYIVSIVQATRQHTGLRLGASPRASQTLYRTSQAMAALNNRNYVLPDDIQLLAVPTLAHRLLPKSSASSVSKEIVQELLRTIPVPV